VRRVVPVHQLYHARSSVAREDVQDEIDVVARQDRRAVLVGQRDLDGLQAALQRATSDLSCSGPQSFMQGAPPILRRARADLTGL
jgi:hypothetical protein